MAQFAALAVPALAAQLAVQIAGPELAAQLVVLAGHALLAHLAVHLAVAMQLAANLARPEIAAEQPAVQLAVQLVVQFGELARPQIGGCALEQHIHPHAIL